MKKNISILVLFLSFVVFQGCGSKTGVSEQETAEAKLVSENAEAQLVKEADAVSAKKAMLAEELTKKAEERSQAIASKAKSSATYKTAAGKLIYYKAEVDPSYIGGQRELRKFLRDNLKYPQEAKDNNIEGTVFVDFVIDRDGKVGEVVASDMVGDVDASLKEEAIRVVAAMPGWKAGMQGSRPVDVSFSIPITFDLGDNN